MNGGRKTIFRVGSFVVMMGGTSVVKRLVTVVGQ